MKKLLLFAALAVAATSCSDADDFLEPKTNAITEATVFSDSIRTIGFLSNIYSGVGYSFDKGRWSSHGNSELATDDAEYSLSGAFQAAVLLYNGSLSALTGQTSPEIAALWNNPYTNIRKVNLFLQKLPTTPLSAGTQRRVAAEARFLRAWYYHHLLINYGGIPLIGDEVFDITDFPNYPRNSYAECVDYLVSELDAVAEILPTAAAGPGGYTEQNYGRATKGAAQALKSRVLLYAASPLFNGGAETTDPELQAIVSYPTYSGAHWQRAADAALAVINSNQYSLYRDNTRPGNGFYQVFLRRVNPEYIFALYRTPNKDFEGYYLPPTRSGATYSMPTHNIAEAFPMKNGKPITDPTSGYDPRNPYANRDPRFGYTIIYNTSRYFLQSTGRLEEVLTYDGAPNDGFTPAGQRTGYFCRKMCDENLANNSPGQTERGWPLMRYAEILLNYAEAINEAGQPQLAYPKLIELRERAGIEPGANNMYGLPVGMSVDQMREVIRNERRIELAFEDHRWNDIRRWKIAVAVNNGYNKRMQITRGGAAPNFTYTYNVTNSVRLHVFKPAQYLMPITDNEIRKMPLMRQNPGY
ncbi:RagB/SusD family nutrient uptake outer membrane protein [Hymenobacter sp.]|jgi:hypothetical protein|uniref:RagB/SusD family nutrient uptake outer membrane protein n=1 Tax=Hymenobacter sp. TaxID=1898978 RepID=UPI002EDB310E